MSGELQIGAWYHFWSTTVHQGVMDYGQLVKVLDGFCTFTNAVRTTSVPVEFVVSESAPCVTGDGQSGQSEALPINLG